jgi:NAD+ kinase
MPVREPPQRVAVVAHPTRRIEAAVETLQHWAAERGLEVLQIQAVGSVDRGVAPYSDLEPGDLVVALGGDGTVLSALRAAARVGAPVLGAACGSLGALTACTAGELRDALERVYLGDWTARVLPALGVCAGGAPDEWAINDFVAVRHGTGQLVANVSVNDELYVRLAGDGLIVATALGSSAYSMAASGPVLVAGTQAFVFTPLAMHGGNAPPLVIPADATLHVELHPGFAGFEIEIDGHAQPADELDYAITLHQEKVTLVGLDGPSLGLTGLRERRLISDSARVLARDERARDLPASRAAHPRSR